MKGYVAPSVNKTAFSCPHCGAHTTQYWHSLWAERKPGKDPLPFFITGEVHRKLLNNSSDDLSPEKRASLLAYAERAMVGVPLLEPRTGDAVYPDFDFTNVHVSQCYSCGAPAIWLRDKLLFPSIRSSVEPNDDMNEDVRADFEEARTIVDLSPRGAAALLRLAVQKLCAQLGEKGKNIDDDIKSLVSKGLNPLVQKALDVVRVIGNESVHPGTLDLRDNRETANQLFSIVNAIAQQMITQPKEIEEIYQSLPAEKLAAIDVRNSKAKNQS